MLQKVSFNIKRKRFNVLAENCSEFGKIRGLMFRKRENATPLLFEFKKPVNLSIHSFFVFFPFIAIWIDEQEKVIKMEKILPFTLSVGPKEQFKKIIEIPINKKNSKKMKFFVGD